MPGLVGSPGIVPYRGGGGVVAAPFSCRVIFLQVCFSMLFSLPLFAILAPKSLPKWRPKLRKNEKKKNRGQDRGAKNDAKKCENGCLQIVLGEAGTRAGTLPSTFQGCSKKLQK